MGRGKTKSGAWAADVLQDRAAVSGLAHLEDEMDEQEREASRRLSLDEFERWKKFRLQGEKQEEAEIMAALGEMCQALLEAQKTTMRLTEENRTLAGMARQMTGQVPGLERLLGDVEELEATSMRLMDAAPTKYLEQLVRMGANAGKGCGDLGTAGAEEAEDSPGASAASGSTSSGSRGSPAPAGDDVSEEGLASHRTSMSQDSPAFLAPGSDAVPEPGAGMAELAAVGDASPELHPRDALAFEAPDSDAVPMPGAGIGRKQPDPGGAGRPASRPEDAPAQQARRPARRTRRVRDLASASRKHVRAGGGERAARVVR